MNQVTLFAKSGFLDVMMGCFLDVLNAVIDKGLYCKPGGRVEEHF